MEEQIGTVERQEQAKLPQSQWDTHPSKCRSHKKQNGLF
jgi:hypothetical protein